VVYVIGALMRKILFLICVLGIPCASWARTNQASWTNLGALHAGQKIQVVEMNLKKHSGAFVNVSDTAISYRETAGEQIIQKQDVRSVKLMENRHRLRNTLIGAAVGAGVGAVIGAATDHTCSGPDCFNIIGKGGAAGIVAVVGFVGGAVVGALLPTHNTIYSVH
jgi:hypothetical protein